MAFVLRVAKQVYGSPFETLPLCEPLYRTRKRGDEGGGGGGVLLKGGNIGTSYDNDLCPVMPFVTFFLPPILYTKLTCFGMVWHGFQFVSKTSGKRLHHVRTLYGFLAKITSKQTTMSLKWAPYPPSLPPPLPPSSCLLVSPRSRLV